VTAVPNMAGAYHGEILAQARALIEAGKLAPRLDPRRFTLQTTGDAYQSIKDGSAQGKLVVDIVPPAVRGTN
jgi:NADPH:quinone reductase